jgi:2-oxoglutarate dehydrogenase E2 component (dihydrolipoamide succinyltransferase)
VNASESGTIKEFLVNEEDTVTVGQDLVKIELGAAPEGGKKDEGAEKPKEPEPKEPEPKKDASPAPAETQKPKEPEPKKAAPPKEAPKTESKPQAAEQPALGGREERRVC